MAQCSACFFGQTTETISGTVYRLCRRDAPSQQLPGPNPGSPSYTWPTVQDTDWCGDGADNITGISYASNVNNLPSQNQSPVMGTFTLAAATSTVVTDPRVGASSQIIFWPTNSAAALLLQGGNSFAAYGLYVSVQSAGVGFTVHTLSGSAAGTETFGYQIIG